MQILRLPAIRMIEFSKIRNISDLAKNLYCSEDELIKLSSSTPQIKFYKKMNIPKKNRKLNQYRTVYKAIDGTLSLIHKNLELSINLAEKFPHYVHGFVRGRSIITNARVHLAKKLILSVDIKDFFESIKIDRVFDAFVYLGCQPNIATSLSRICTLNGILVQGLSTSPVLANIVCRKMDKDLLDISRRYNCKYTRYADDITFSGDDGIPSKKEIEQILQKHSFSLSHKKYKVQKRGQNQYVTGLTVFDKEYPRIPKKIKKNLRLILYFANKYGFKNHLKKNNIDIKDDYLVLEQIDKIGGWIKFMFGVEPKLAFKFNALWINILSKYWSETTEKESRTLKLSSVKPIKRASSLTKGFKQ